MTEQTFRPTIGKIERSPGQQAKIMGLFVIIYYISKLITNNPTFTPPNHDDVRDLHAPHVVHTEPQAPNGDAKPSIPDAPKENTEREEVEKRTTIQNILDNQRTADGKYSGTKI